MNRYFSINIVEVCIFLIVSCIVWKSPNRILVQLLLIIGSFAISAVITPLVRKEILRRVKAIDAKAFLVLQDLSPFQATMGFNTGNMYPFDEETLKLVDWWNLYTTIGFVTHVVPMVLLIAASELP